MMNHNLSNRDLLIYLRKRELDKDMSKRIDQYKFEKQV
jgi:hypothetical protein